MYKELNKKFGGLNHMGKDIKHKVPKLFSVSMKFEHPLAGMPKDKPVYIPMSKGLYGFPDDSKWISWKA